MNADHIMNIAPYDPKTKHWRVIIETPKGSHNKYNYDEQMGVFILGGVLPEGMSFPYDFGFLPGTLGEDGDPLDVLLLMDHAAFCGCVVPSRLIGVIEAEQIERDGTKARNDRLVAVPVKAHVHSDTASLEDLNENRVREISEFFISYNRIGGKAFNVLGINGTERAETLARQGIQKASPGEK